MLFSDAVERVEKHPWFTDEQGYLVHGFCTLERGEWSPWQIGYYRVDGDTITSYTVADELERSEPAEVFKKEGAIPRLDRDRIRLPHEDAAQAAHERLRRQHPGHDATKTLLLVQVLPEGQVYNFTIVTDTLHMYNLKLDTATGEILGESFDSLMALRSDE